MKRTTFAFTLSLICATLSSAGGRAMADEAKSPSPKDQLDKFVGTGTCTGTIVAMGDSPGHTTTGKYRGEKTLDGQWVVIHYDEDKTDANPKPFHVQQYFSYDPDKKMFVAVEFDNMNSSYTLGKSAGWKGDTLTLGYTASMDGKLVQMRDVFTHTASESSHTGMMRDKDGKWVQTDKETCKRT